MDKHLNFYSEYYNLPIFTSQEFVGADFIESIKTRHNFVTIVICHNDKKFLLLRNLNKNIGWEMPGGYINEDEQPEAAAHRIAFGEAGLSIDELQPIAIVKNIFTHGQLSIVHEGVAYIALSRDRLKPFPPHYTHIFTEHIPDEVAYQNKSIFLCAQKYLEREMVEPPYEEIESIKRSSVAYFFNKHIIKPIGMTASRKIFKKIESIISPQPQSIIDVSCGDSSNIVELQMKNPDALCVGNDISWRTMSHIKKHNPDVIFTNHDVVDLPFKKTFDVILFKNTLHHIPKNKQGSVLRDLANRSKQLIVVDINDPTKTNLLSKLWNRYYVWFLDDQGNTFLDNNSFRSIIKSELPDKSLFFGEINTIKGIYMFANITNKV